MVMVVESNRSAENGAQLNALVQVGKLELAVYKRRPECDNRNCYIGNFNVPSSAARTIASPSTWRWWRSITCCADAPVSMRR